MDTSIYAIHQPIEAVKTNDFGGSTSNKENMPLLRGALGPKKMTQLKCRKLSKRNCSKRPECEFIDNLCYPKYSASQQTGQVESYDQFFFESRRLWRSGVIQWLSEVGCNVNEFMQNIKTFTGKNSASESIIITSMIQPTVFDSVHKGVNDSNIVIKLTFKPLNPLDNSLEVERAIYQNIITKLVNDRNTPNVMSYLGSTSCVENFSDIFKRKQRDIIRPYVKQIEATGNYGTRTKNFLFLERSDGMELKNWLDTSRSEEDILSVIFQVMYTLLCFRNIRLIHNDLHFGNIFVELVRRPVTLYYVRGPGTWVKLVTNVIVKIYDFDRGSIDHPTVPRNLELDKDYCKGFGTCNKFNPKYDYFQFVATLQYYLSEIDPQIKHNIKFEWIAKILDFFGWYKNRGYTRYPPIHHFIYEENPTDAQLKPIDQAISILLTAPWTNAPFTEEKGDISLLPEELTFTPPAPKTAKTVQWTPVSTEAHPALSIILGDYEYDVIYNYENKMIVQIWKDESGIDPAKFRDELWKEIQKIKPTASPYWYLDASTWLGWHMFHRLGKVQRNALLNNNVELIAVVDDIWNMFNNKLPIQIPVIEYY